MVVELKLGKHIHAQKVPIEKSVIKVSTKILGVGEYPRAMAVN
jgi:hypothetical protein